MGLIITLIVFVGLAAIIVWIADWTSGGVGFDLTRDEIWFLNALRAAGERGRTVSSPESRASGNFCTCPSFPAGGASHRLVAMGLVAICSRRWQHDKHFKRIDGVDLPNCTQ